MAKSPYQDWFSISDSNGWMNHAKAAAQGQDVDINTARTDTTKKGPEYGVQWVHKAHRVALLAIKCRLK